MKKFILICVGVIIGLLAYAIADHFGVVPKVEKESTTAVTDDQEESIETFYDVDEFLNFVGNLRNCEKVDSILLHAPDDMISNIAFVCIQRYGKVDRAIFYREYMSSDIYKLLPKSTQIVETPQTAPPINNEGQAVKTDTVVQAVVPSTPPNN